MVVIAIDYGEKKIGLAVGNTETMTSSPISICLLYTSDAADE